MVLLAQRVAPQGHPRVGSLDLSRVAYLRFLDKKKVFLFNLIISRDILIDPSGSISISTHNIYLLLRDNIFSSKKKRYYLYTYYILVDIYSGPDGPL